MRSVEPPFVRERWFSANLNNCPQFGQFVLQEEDFLEQRLVLHDDDVGLGVDADPGDVVVAQLHWQPDRDSSEKWIILALNFWRSLRDIRRKVWPNICTKLRYDFPKAVLMTN